METVTNSPNGNQPSKLSEIDVQCSKAKQEIYKLKGLIDAHIHKERRDAMTEMWQEAYDAFDKLQAFAASR